MDMNQTITLQYSKDRTPSTPLSSMVSPASKREISLPKLDLSIQKEVRIFGMAQDGHPDAIHGPINALIRHLHMPGHLVDGYCRFKESLMMDGH
jgi:hypothetical protein